MHEHRVASVIRPSAAGVQKQMIHCDSEDRIGKPAAIHITENSVLSKDARIEGELLFLHSHHHRCGRDGFRNARDAKSMLRSHSLLAVSIGKPKTLFERNIPVATKCDRQSRKSVLAQEAVSEVADGIDFRRRGSFWNNGKCGRTDGESRCTGNTMNKATSVHDFPLHALAEMTVNTWRHLQTGTYLTPFRNPLALPANFMKACYIHLNITPESGRPPALITSIDAL